MLQSVAFWPDRLWPLQPRMPRPVPIRGTRSIRDDSQPEYCPGFDLCAKAIGWTFGVDLVFGREPVDPR